MQITPTMQRNIAAFTSWLINEIGGNYWLIDEHGNSDRRSYYKQPKGVHQFVYRTPCRLVAEHDRVFTLFVNQLFEHFLKTGNSQFDNPTATFNSIIPFANLLAESSCEVMTIGHEKSALACCLLFNREFPSLSNLLTENTLDNIMWCLCDLNDAIISKSYGMRKIFIADSELPTTEYAYNHDRQSQKKQYRRHRDDNGNIHWTKTVYTITEEWCTDAAHGNTFQWNYYSFDSFKDAKIFMLRLLTKLNTTEQCRLLQFSEHFATKITENFKATVQMLFNSEEKQKKMLAKRPNKSNPSISKKLFTHSIWATELLKSAFLKMSRSAEMPLWDTAA